MKGIVRWFLVLGVMAALVITACAAPAAPAPAPAPTPAPAPAPAPTPGAELTREQKLVEAAKANGETEVVLWTMSWYEGPVEKAFEARYPFLKLRVWDGSVSVESKLLEEYKAGKYTPDVLEQPLYRVVREQAAGVLQEYDWPNTEGWLDQPPTNFYRFDQTSTRVPMYNTKLVSGADIPQSWADLNDPKWRGKSMISMSAGGWLLNYAYEIGDFTAEGVKWDRSVAFWKEVVATTKPQMGRGFKGPLEQLVIGDVSIMHMAAGTTGLYLIRAGAPVEFAPLKEIPGDPWAIALPKNPPHPNAARLLLDFLTSDEGNLIHSNIFPNPTYHPRVADKAYANQYFAGRGMEIVTFPMDIWKPEYSAKADSLWVKDILGLK